MVAPLKLEGTGGDLKEMTTAEEYYLAYQAGLQLAAMATTDIAALDPTAGGTTIGSYANTFYNQAVGTHPGSSLSIGTTTTTLYQNTGTASETGITRPIRFTSAGTRVDEFNDTNFNEVVDRLLPIIMANEYPGTYRLASSTPGAAWDTHIASVFTDTRQGAATITYNIYQRQSITAPTTVNPLKLADASGNLKEMTAAEIKLTFGQRAKTRIMSSADNVGAYQLRSSAQGVPIAGGTWVARGTATDSRNTTAEINYSADYTRNRATDFTRNRATDFSANYQRTREEDFTVNREVDYTINRATDFSATYSANYQRNRVTNRATNFVGNYVNPDAINYTRTRATTYRRNPSGGYYQGNFVGDYLGAASYAGDYIGDFIGDFIGDYIGDFLGNYIGDFAGNYVGGNFIGNYVGGNYLGDYVGNYIGDFAGNYIGDFAGNYIGDYVGTTIVASNTTIETYTLYCRTA